MMDFVIRSRCRWVVVCGLSAAAFSLMGCSSLPQSSEQLSSAALTPATPTSRDLRRLPPPKGRVLAAVYAFRDQSGQYRPAPDSSFSTAVTQGGAAILIKALKDSGWFTPVERENLQDLLTERKIVRALEQAPPSKDAQPAGFPALLAASILVEGGVTAFESNVRTGGIAARYLGIGLSTQYRVDQVTVNLRSVDIRGGQILHSISTTKTIYSYEVHPSVFKFVNFKDLVELEAGMTRNEPAQLCVKDAIEAAVIHLVTQGLRDRSWTLKNQKDWNSPLLQKYFHQDDGGTSDAPAASAGS